MVYQIRWHGGSVQFSSVAQSCPALCYPRNHSTPGIPVHHQLLEFTKTHVHRVHDTIQPSHPLSSPSPSAPNPSQHQSLSNESTLRRRWPKYWSFTFSISPSKEHPGLISFRMEWLDLFAVQGTFKSLLQHHSSKASILQCSAPGAGASLVAQRLKCLPPTWYTWVWSRGWDDPLEKEMATHSSVLAWRIPGTVGSCLWGRTESDTTEVT